MEKDLGNVFIFEFTECIDSAIVAYFEFLHAFDQDCLLDGHRFTMKNQKEEDGDLQTVE